MKKVRPPDFWLLIVSLFLVSMGVIMVFSASCVTSASSAGQGFDPYYYLKRQIFFALLGFLAMGVTLLIPLEFYRRWATPIFLLVLLLLLTVLLPGIGRTAGGSTRWIHLGPLALQPSELAKIALAIFLAKILTLSKGGVRTFRGIFLVLLLTAPALFLTLIEPDFSTAFLLGMTVIAAVFLAGARITHLVTTALLLLPVVIVALMHESYRVKRWLAFLNPWKDPLDAGYHIIQGLLALGSGGMLGLGLGGSEQKFFYLPAQHTDYIFAVIGEEGGFVATSLVLIGFLFLAYRGFAIAMEVPSPFGSLLAGILTTTITVQALLNMAMVAGLFPPIGVPLPFLSYGGSSLITTLASVGILLGLSRYGTTGQKVPLRDKLYMEGMAHET